MIGTAKYRLAQFSTMKNEEVRQVRYYKTLLLMMMIMMMMMMMLELSE